MQVEIDKYSGFCFGVTRAIKNTENLLNNSDNFFCLGNIVHNNKEQERLKKLGLSTIDYEDIDKLLNQNLIIRAHGESPEIYNILKRNNLNIFDNTCPVVLKLQQKIRKIYLQNPKNQILIFGKKKHPEVNGLLGQTNDSAIIISSFEEAKSIKMRFPFFLFAQTTADLDEYLKIQNYLKKFLSGNDHEDFFFDTICPSVKNRIPQLREFCKNHDVIVFVSDYESSNGKMLFDTCKKNNESSYFVTDEKDLKTEWFGNFKSVGISGATSTPIWLMENIKNEIINLILNQNE
ncbi:MAG: 4-hydroxy-3-methylbut-2-enyl diphosphate reductase [Bacteroidales bacterium]|jgi:4-hydroxy-3-methylbut-2-enyl diphosphate reductase|nr:4-hydroxy-3-methylbut-2-enyl diphosphate reductase [Bacteroidales bacterium]